MKKHLLALLAIVCFFAILPLDISQAYMYQEDIYLDIKLSNPLVANNLINLESEVGFALIDKNNKEDLLFVINETNIKASIGQNGYIELLDEDNYSLFTLPSDGNILISSLDINNSIIKIEKDRYRDYLKLTKISNQIMVINHVNLENYLYGVVPREMAYSYPLEALKAQSVASRSFALSNTKHKNAGYDLCDTTDCQVYLGYDSEHPTTNQAVDETNGVLALYEGEAIQAMYHSTSSGMTEDSANAWGGNLPYLKSVRDEFSTDAPYSNWKFTISLRELNSKLLSAGIDVGGLDDMEILETTPAGSVSKVRISGPKGDEIITGSRLRSIIGSITLKSTWFTINSNNKESNRNLVYVIDGNTNSIKSVDLNEAYILDEIRLERPSRSTSRTMSGKNRQKDINASITTTTSTSDIVIEGRGFGHGVGMSQIGAKKMAELGYTFDEILKHYYTGIDVY